MLRGRVRVLHYEAGEAQPGEGGCIPPAFFLVSFCFNSSIVNIQLYWFRAYNRGTQQFHQMCILKTSGFSSCLVKKHWKRSRVEAGKAVGRQLLSKQEMQVKVNVDGGWLWTVDKATCIWGVETTNLKDQ